MYNKYCSFIINLLILKEIIMRRKMVIKFIVKGIDEADSAGVKVVLAIMNTNQMTRVSR